ncbi:MAG: hypothetical protein J5806_02760 [Lentisphaeria bacterium]|nr:hypothetical protein [Lentisphaeria bacterium]
MKHIHLAIVGSAAAAFLLTGCGTTSDYVDSQDTTVAVKNSNRMSSSDWVIAVEKQSAALLSSQELQEFLNDYAKDAAEKLKKAEAEGEKITARERRTALRPLLMLSDIENKTGEHIETQLLSERLRELMFNSGKFRFTTYAAGNGQKIDSATADARDLAKDKNIRKRSAMKKGKVNAYDLSLSGTIIKQRASSGRAKEISYFFSLTLTDNETGEGVWAKTYELKRQHTESVFGY